VIRQVLAARLTHQNGQFAVFKWSYLDKNFVATQVFVLSFARRVYASIY